nr:hypothetical protein [Salibacterium salarium]
MRNIIGDFELTMALSGIKKLDDINTSLLYNK